MCACYNILASITCNNEFDDDKPYSGSDPVYREYLETMIEQLEDDWKNLESDFEVVCYDTPTNANEQSKGPYTYNW